MDKIGSRTSAGQVKIGQKAMIDQFKIGVKAINQSKPKKKAQGVSREFLESLGK